MLRSPLQPSWQQTDPPNSTNDTNRQVFYEQYASKPHSHINALQMRVQLAQCAGVEISNSLESTIEI
jgi:hypothetical protein